MSKINLNLVKLDNALIALEKIYLLPDSENRMNIDATIQRFEFTFELFWKTLKAFFSKKGLEINYPKDILKEAYVANILENEKVWLKMLRDRNMSSHSYDENLANEIFNNIKTYVPLLREAFNHISTLS